MLLIGLTQFSCLLALFPDKRTLSVGKRSTLAVMGRHQQHTDAEVVAAVAAIRAEHGACTLQRLAEQLGVSKSGAHERVQRMVDEGLLQHDGPGGLRPIAQPYGAGTLQLNLLVQVDPDTGKPVAVELAG